ncbi:MAG: hypothetical protein Q9188_003163 [Gyalolechia gomerana]
MISFAEIFPFTPEEDQNSVSQEAGITNNKPRLGAKKLAQQKTKFLNLLPLDNETEAIDALRQDLSAGKAALAKKLREIEAEKAGLAKREKHFTDLEQRIEVEK